jgi:hypothetical protein
MKILNADLVGKISGEKLPQDGGTIVEFIDPRMGSRRPVPSQPLKG